MISLNKYCENITGLWSKNRKIISSVNIDDIFRHLRRLGIDEVEINEEQMGLITSYFSANCEQVDEWIEAVKTAKIDEFLGIKLILI